MVRSWGPRQGHLDAHGDGVSSPGVITINECLAGGYPLAQTNPTATKNTGGCVTNIDFPANVDTAFASGTIIWQSCQEFQGPHKTGLKFNDLNGNHVPTTASRSSVVGRSTSTVPAPVSRPRGARLPTRSRVSTTSRSRAQDRGESVKDRHR